MFRPDSKFRIWWDLGVMVCATWNCFAVPFAVAFDPPFMSSTGMFVFNSVIDIIFLLDIFIVFRTTFINSNNGSEIVEPHSIAWNYTKGQLTIDVLATIPLDSFTALFFANSVYFQGFGILKLIRVLRLSRIISYMRVVETVKASLRLIKLIFYLILYVHCVGCAWFFTVKVHETWMPPLDYVWVATTFYEEGVWF